MFTGLVSGTGVVGSLKKSGPDCVLAVTPGFAWDEPLAIGESVSVSGVCLTVTAALAAGSFEAFASAETLRRANLGPARRVNLERALRLSDRLGGHLVSGHVDGPAVTVGAAKEGKSVCLTFRAARELARLIVPKGSVALDGVSLTVNSASDGLFSVNVIPQTLAATTLGDLRAGDKVNLEADLIARYVEYLLPGRPAEPAPRGEQPGSALSDFLKQAR
ncbi:MAG: riboflavin synthase [Deltaproteobacteria bacterium]|jgi:riboflavin synthase|nr:riboflavin synthase [Deltaproteobacteria bacterium]